VDTPPDADADEARAAARSAVLGHARRLAAREPLTLGHALRSAAVLRAALDDELRSLVEQARGSGATWSDIGGALGVSTQAAQQRFGQSERRT
jgi:hypothetical protein